MHTLGRLHKKTLFRILLLGITAILCGSALIYSWLASQIEDALLLQSSVVPSIGGFAFAVCMMLMATYFIALRQLIFPIQTIQRTLAKSASGDRKACFDIVADDTLDELKQALNSILEAQNNKAAEIQARNDASPLGLFRSDSQGNLLYINKAYHEITGLDFDEVLQGDWLNLIHVDDRDKVIGAWRNLLENHQTFDMIYRHRHPVGHLVWINAKTVVIKDGASVNGYFGFLQNITQQKNAESELREHRDHLKELVKERTAELVAAKEAAEAVSEKLLLEIRERKLAEQTVEEHARNLVLEQSLRRSQKLESIGTLAAGIAHDFNNLLGVIMGFTEVTLDSIPTGNQAHDNLTHVLTAAERARELVSQILAFSRQDEPHKLNIALPDLINESVKLLRATFASNIEIKTQINAPKMIVYADPGHLQQVIMNLCVNANHAMRVKGGTLAISLSAIELIYPMPAWAANLTPGWYTQLSVCDSGVGISTENLDRIFDPFFTTKEVGEGSGLGLSVVHGIVARYGGAIQVQSELKKGTRFDVYLPLAESIIEKKAEPQQIMKPVGNGRILLVDDQQLLIEVGRRMLQTLGYEPITTLSAEKALAMVKAEPDSFTAVITDQTMPFMSGAELAQHILKIRPDMPILLWTGFSHSIDKEKAEAIGIKEFLLKPVAVGDLGNAILRAIQSSEANNPLIQHAG